jgi:hypothetical protein
MTEKDNHYQYRYISYLRIIYRIISENLIIDTFPDWHPIAIIEHDGETTNEDPR